MAIRNILCAAALAAATLPVSAAGTTWSLQLDGHGMAAAGGTEGCSPDHPEQCVQDVGWHGTLQVVTAGSADGTYSGDGFLALQLDANLSELDFTAFPSGPTWLTAPSATIVGGVLAWLDVHYTDEGEDGNQIVRFSVDGLQASYYTAGYHTNYADLAGTLSSVPEPATFACMLAGLLALARARSRA